MPAAGSEFAAMRAGELERTRDRSMVSENERRSGGVCTTASRLVAKDADVTIGAGPQIELGGDGGIRTAIKVIHSRVTAETTTRAHGRSDCPTHVRCARRLRYPRSASQFPRSSLP